ncbi:hypothetical protein OSTOST_25181, partial [Ostertagia ostertagi]
QPLDLSQIRSQLWAKESQIAAMRSKISELERKLTKRSDEFYELMAEKDMIAQRLAQQTNADSVEELKLARNCAFIIANFRHGTLCHCSRKGMRDTEEK